MQYPGQRVQVDVKVVPLKCLANPEERLYQYTAIDEYTRLRYLGAYPEQSTYSSADFLEKNGSLVQTPWRAGRVCANRQRIRIHQPFFQQQKEICPHALS